LESSGKKTEKQDRDKRDIERKKFLKQKLIVRGKEGEKERTSEREVKHN
jgi:hypothetical protein